MASIGIQLILYSFVGAIACCVDVGLFLCFTQIWHANPILVTSLSFSTATLVNYYLCFRYIFARGQRHLAHQIFRTFFVAIVGLIFNTMGLVFCLRWTHFSPLAAKLILIPLIMVWNFWGRRTLVHAPEIPPETLKMVERLLKSFLRFCFKLRN